MCVLIIDLIDFSFRLMETKGNSSKSENVMRMKVYRRYFINKVLGKSAEQAFTTCIYLFGLLMPVCAYTDITDEESKVRAFPTYT